MSCDEIGGNRFSSIRLSLSITMECSLGFTVSTTIKFTFSQNCDFLEFEEHMPMSLCLVNLAFNDTKVQSQELSP